ncbi:hypothetical protein Tco_0379562 [Tanacetum coccineum]
MFRIPHTPIRPECKITSADNASGCPCGQEQLHTLCAQASVRNPIFVDCVALLKDTNFSGHQRHLYDLAIEHQSIFDYATRWYRPQYTQERVSNVCQCSLSTMESHLVYDQHVPYKQNCLDIDMPNIQLSNGEQHSLLKLETKVTKPKAANVTKLAEVQGKGKEKVVDEQAAHDLLTLQTLTKKSLMKPAWTQTPGEQDEGQQGPKPCIQDDGQGLIKPQKPEQMDEEFTTTAYPNVQENLKLPTEDQVILEEPASSMGTLSSLQNLEKDLSFTD